MGKKRTESMKEKEGGGSGREYKDKRRGDREEKEKKKKVSKNRMWRERWQGKHNNEMTRKRKKK